MKHFPKKTKNLLLNDSFDLLENSFLLINSKLKDDELSSENKIFDSDIQNLYINSNNENKTIDENISILSIPSDGENELNKYKIYNTKVINSMLPNIIDKGKTNKSRNIKKSDNKNKIKFSPKIINVLFSIHNNNINGNQIMINELDRNFINCSKNDLANKSKLAQNNLDINKKRQNELKKQIRVKFEKSIRLKRKNNNNLINKYKPKKIEKMKEIINKQKLKIKMKFKKPSPNINYHFTDISQILNKFKNYPNRIKRNINNNNLISFISNRKRNDRINANINKSIFKKKVINISKNLSQKLDGFTPLNFVKKIKINDKNNLHKRNNYNTISKNSKHLILKTTDSYSKISKFSFTNTNASINLSNYIKNPSYLSLNKKVKNIIKKDKRNYISLRRKTQKLTHFPTNLCKINRTTNNPPKKIENSKTKEKNKNNTTTPAKLNISSNNKKFKRLTNIICSYNMLISNPNSFKNANKCYLQFNGNKILRRNMKINEYGI